MRDAEQKRQQQVQRHAHGAEADLFLLVVWFVLLFERRTHGQRGAPRAPLLFSRSAVAHRQRPVPHLPQA
jgi:hypothetical protein